MSAARRRMRGPQMLSVSKQDSRNYPQTRAGAYVFTRYREQRRRRAIAIAVVVLAVVAAALIWWFFLRG